MFEIRFPKEDLGRFLPLLLMVAAVALVSGGPASMAGDSPHYLAVSDSLFRDWDLDLSNQYAPGGPYLFVPDDVERHAVTGRGGRYYPFHPLGLSLLYAPVVVPVQAFVQQIPEPILAKLKWDRFRAARDLLSMTMAFLWTACAMMTREVAMQLGVARRRATWLVALVFLSPPLLNHAILIFTEIPATLLVLSFVLLMLSPRRSSWWPFLPLAALPWFHLRYSVIAASGFVWWVVRAKTANDSTRRDFLLGGALALASLAAICTASWLMFETWNPFGHYQGGITEVTFGSIQNRLIRVLVDPHRGILVIAPFYLLALGGICDVMRTNRSFALFTIAVLLATYLLASANRMWWGGYSPPARFLVPVLPLLVPLLSLGIDQLQRRRLMWMALGVFAWSIALAVLLLSSPIDVWSEPVNGRGVMARVMDLIVPDG